MDEQQVNCIISACCCEADCGPKKRKALAEIIHAKLGHGPYSAEVIADLMITLFDFAPKGKLSPLIEEVAKLIKAGPVSGLSRDGHDPHRPYCDRYDFLDLDGDFCQVE